MGNVFVLQASKQASKQAGLTINCYFNKDTQHTRGQNTLTRQPVACPRDEKRKQKRLASFSHEPRVHRRNGAL